MVMSSLASACCTWEATERTTVSTIMRTSKVPNGARVDNRRSSPYSSLEAFSASVIPAG